ncbi:DUF4114 domain-containing protein [Flavobacterium arcticum]|uniref:DUF4114 domain-containing protein n=1 Tax=Flavobacterium arcticum TaxID=1784713 RepID=A0A345HF32_9FLAO|nr:DUF4114 domain-containing protein [Flavobacterium arcticum]AXG75192.1 DUF4114 domain-containing protein [Flavobacterium arcticum]KAF2510452.1 DUF4114 domain-containing protein [Flavobacterium arcticum]
MRQLLLLTTLLLNTILFAQDYQFLGNYNGQGVPAYLEQPGDVVTQATLDLVSNSIPEGFPVPVYNPQYISAGYDTDLIIDASAAVWVTFVQEGAGYRNILGFYTYDINNPPTSTPQPEDITIVFPNISASGSGGGLLAGDKVKIGDFEAGTGVGWVLLANGWNGSVTSGQWQLFSNPDFNPEADEDLRNHNVLLADPDNERLILGFEDIRRDYSSCDNDFNDAVFYITSNPYTAMRVANVADVSTAADVSSGNDGGLESNGDLARLIAKRNFKRVQTNSFLNKKSLQSPFTISNMGMKSTMTTIESLFPDTGMFGNETAFISSPEDLIGITNADEIFSIDYYNGSERVAAALATKTTDAVYDHSKVICDRLNGSSLEDVRTIKLQGHEIIMVKLKRANGIIEYALSFSIEENASQNILHSYWNIAQYPTANYTNFQFWGANMGQVCSVANHVLNQLEDENPVIATEMEDRIPSVFVKNGVYRNGMLTLEIVNKTMASTLTFEGNKKVTELADTENFTEEITLNTDFNQTIQVNTNGIFDIGFSINANTSVRNDGLYMADGPWGVDYNETEASVSAFNVEPYIANTETENGVYNIERDATVSGTLYGTVNLFRNILAGELTFDASEYEAVNFNYQSSHAIEVVMVTEGLSDWNNRLRFQIPANQNMTEYSITLSSFSNGTESYEGGNIKEFVFSIIGNYTSFEPFTASVSALRLGTQAALNTNTFEALSTTKMFNYPNPFSGNTTIVLPQQTSKANVQLVDMTGRVVMNNNYTVSSNNEIAVTADGLPKGIYIMMVTTEENKTYQTRCAVQ